MAPPNHNFRYDVFLSFRGEDTCYTFTDHLYKALLRAGLRTFRDDDAIQLGDELKLEIKDAIKESRASIVVLSENYGSSRWCLDELSLILEQRKKYNHIVLPVFYRVDRLAVREQGRSFSVEGSNWTVANTIRWKEALTDVADLSGMVLVGYKTYETDFIEEVVETVNIQLDSKQMNTPAHLTGTQTVNSQLDLKQMSAPVHLTGDTQLDVKQPSTPAHSTGMETFNSQIDLTKLSTPAHLTGKETVNSQLDVKQPSTPAHSTEMETLNSQLKLKKLSIPAHSTGMETGNSQPDLTKLRVPAHLTRMQTHVSYWLKDEQCNALAICGMGGSGKTTLAKFIYNLNKQDFASSSFVEEIGKRYKHDVLELQKQLLRDVLRIKEIKISSVSEGTNKIVEILQMKKVLIVLDDIDDQYELSALLGIHAFPTQSKIIITTRRLDIYEWFGSISWRCWVHIVKFLNDLESLELLSLHAFGSKIPMEGFEVLAKELAQYCGGNPLALKVLGSSLSVSDEDSSTKSNLIEIWRKRLNSLNSLRGDLDLKIQHVLRKSFDSLPLDSHKELFLDIACFFVGESEDMVTTLMDGLHAKSMIKTLVNRCLLIVSPDTGKLMMHQLLQDMGRKIVHEESRYPSKRSRVWHDDAYHVLRKGEGSNTIEGLALDMRKIKQGMGSEPLALKTSSLAKIEKLKLLQLKYVTLTGSYKNFPELRWLCWHGSNLKRIPSGLLSNSLVAIDMSYGHTETFEAPMVLNSLKILNLEGCVKLVNMYELRRLPKLETLILCACRSLTNLCKYIGDLESLALLDLKGCIKLFKASSYKKNVKLILKQRLWVGGISEQPLFFLPCSLRSLHLDDCQIEINNDVRVSFHAQSFFKLSLGCNPFELLPNSIDLKMVKTLNLYSCPNLKFLSYVPRTLEELYVDCCTSLESITFQSGRFRLQQFSYVGCSQLSEVQGLFKLVPIAEIDEADLVQHMQWIKEYERDKVDLVGDDITKGRIWHTQMLYEYGIMSTYLQGIKDENMMAYEYTSSTGCLLFRVPYHHQKNRIQGLNVSCLYRLSGSKDVDELALFAKISDRSKGLTWVYNPVVYCKPRVDEDAVWLSYWPIGNILDAGDEVHVDIIVDKGLIVSECSASLVYMYGGVENHENNLMKSEEVIGGDLSEFEVTRGGYYLCRRDLFGPATSSRLTWLFDDNIDYPESHGWRKAHQSRMRNVTEIPVTHEYLHSSQNNASGNDVYLSFNGLRTFRDVDAIERGQDIKPAIETAINESRGSIVILSKNYAKSRWCLDELCLILEQRRKSNHIVLPVFYHVDPSDVRNQRGSFSIEGSKWREDDVMRWKEALREVANLKGMVVSGSEVDFITEVVDKISYQLS
ncbi:putative TIR domain, P-loop containing nucleoside triphosphate hydrolase [Helianthus annuus]|nr:putative TIR domain, P-loop containing nucleoside triphosphate hydrolase [Helianthus annuus]KAJ0540935.1 putative TIR domain, P-loop containing nucleoside triphosphate hydrolase [Helianthus annuus]